MYVERSGRAHDPDRAIALSMRGLQLASQVLPHVVAYELVFGPSASYYAWEAAGRPVHGIKAA